MFIKKPYYLMCSEEILNNELGYKLGNVNQNIYCVKLIVF